MICLDDMLMIMIKIDDIIREYEYIIELCLIWNNEIYKYSGNVKIMLIFI